MTTMPTRIIWRSGRDGEAHAHRAGQVRNLCGTRVLAEYLAWPESTRCGTCIRLVTAEMGR